jgi:hypothetical protein
MHESLGLLYTNRTAPRRLSSAAVFSVLALLEPQGG